MGGLFSSDLGWEHCAALVVRHDDSITGIKLLGVEWERRFPDGLGFAICIVSIVYDVVMSIDAFKTCTDLIRALC